MITFTLPLFAVMAALTAPWPPARTTLTTAGLAWRLQCLIWGTMMTRTSTTRTTTKTNLSTPRHSNKHSPSNHLHRGNLVPFCVCFFNPFPPPHPVSPHACISVWLSQGCRWILKEQRCMLHPSFSAPESRAPAPQLWGEMSSKGTVVCGPATTLKSLYV